MGEKVKDLEDLRKGIRSLDESIVSLLNERMSLVTEVAESKAEEGSPVFRPSQESSLLEALQSLNGGPMSRGHLFRIYREVLSASKDLQGMRSVSYLGPPGSYSDQAAFGVFGGSSKLVPVPSIDMVFRDVESGRSELGVVPVENSIEGVVAQTLDRLRYSDASICAETDLPINHNLLSNHALEDVRKVYSHPQAFGQCRVWLSANLPHASAVEVASTAAAVEMAAEEEGAAAIGSLAASRIYGLPVLKPGIQDRAGNVTRFLIIGKVETSPTGDDKTSVCFALKDRAGVLHDALLPLKEEGINMTMIQSRPVRDRNWEYVFFVDILGHRLDPGVERALSGLSRHCTFTQVLGSYPCSNGIQG